MGDPITMGLLAGAVMGAGKTVNDVATAKAAKEENTVANKWAPLLALNKSQGAPLRQVKSPNPLGDIFSGLLGGAAFGQANPGGIFGGGMAGPDTTQIGPWAEGFGKGTMNSGYQPDAYAKGGLIPGKPKVMGDSFKNDSKLILASPGEGLVPRSVMKNPKQKVAAYLNEVKKHGPGPLPMRGGMPPRPGKMSPWAAMACGGKVK